MAKKERLKAESVKIQTPEFRVSYPNVFEPRAAVEGSKKKYSLEMLFAIKGEGAVSIAPLVNIVTALLTEKFGDKSKWPKDLKLPFRKGDETPERAARAGYGANVVSVQASKPGDQIRPGIVHAYAEPGKNTPAPLTVPTDFYGGCYARATINAFYWEYMGKRGVSFGLQNVQKLRDGEPFGSASKAENDFDAIPDPSAGAEAVGAGAGAAAANDPLGGLGA